MTTIQRQDVRELHLSDQVVTSLNEPVTLSNGGSVSGDIELYQHNMHILSGNFIQTASELGTTVKNFSSKNAYIQAEIALKNTLTDSYGIACAGCKGFTILSVDAVNTRLKLDGDLADLAKNDAALTAAWSYALDDASGSSCLYVDHVDAPFVYFKSFPEKLKQLSTLTEADCKLIADKDDNGIYCPAYPDAGISTLNTFYGQHVEGGSTKAFGKYAHAEGRASTADCRYAHAENSETYAGGIGSHAEGFYSKAMGWGSHAEGCGAIALSDITHAEGNHTRAIGKYSHAEGSYTSAYGFISHAEGDYTYAYGEASHAENNQCSAIGKCSHAGGQFTQVSGQCSFGHGFQCQVDANKATALGVNANADKVESYVWSAENAANYDADGKYHAKRDGSYCINPANDISGFYIGNNSLDKIIANAFKVYITAALAEFNGKSSTGTVELADVVATLNKLYAIARKA